MLIIFNTMPQLIIGTGSYIPNNLEETYATADILSMMVKQLKKVENF